MMREELAVASAAQAEVARGCERLLAAALASQKSGDHETAQRLYREILVHEPAHSVALHLLGLAEHAAGRFDRAIDYVKSAIALAPARHEAHSNLAALYRAVGDLDAAIVSVRQAIALAPDFAPAHSNLGGIYEDRGETEAALAAHLHACELDPNLLEAQLNAARLLRKLRRAEEALAICDAATKRHPEAAEAHLNAGDVLRELLRPREAIEAYRRALALQPTLAAAHCNLGNMLQLQGAFDEAIAAYQEAIARDPNLAEAHCNLGAAYQSAGQEALSQAAYRRALECDPGFLGVRIQLYHQDRSACDWTNLEEEEATIAASIAAYRRPVVSFPMLGMEVSPELHLHSSRLWASGFYAKPSFPHQRPAANLPRKTKLKIGYLSADFSNHATALLMVDLFECHDREQFEIIAYSYSDDDCSDVRHRLVQAFDSFVELRELDDREAAQRIFDDGVDILVELKGYTQFARTNIAAHRPAPVQVNFLGYPGTMGVDFVDYIVADPIVLPMNDQAYYSEKIVHLPECYQPNDRRRQVADIVPMRQACGLPEQGFVFCCFNNSYKITPQIFDIWMRLLHAVEGSVLWLFDANPGVKANLLREAEKRGLAPARLVFAPRLSSPEHLARQKLADLFLDTVPINAHTTASEALWVGLPVLTIHGTTFAGRVAASLLHAMDLPELIADSQADYEARALHLATHPIALANLKRKLAANRATSPLFDTPRFTRHIEIAFRRMWDQWAAGGEPEAFSISPIPKQASLGSPATAKISRQRYEACPLCASRDVTVFTAADCTAHPSYAPQFEPKITWLSCQACSHIFVEGYFAPAEAPAAQQARLGAEIEAGRRAAAKIVARVAQYRPQGYWLDVDVGDGALVFTAAEWGFAAQGLDRDEQTVAQLRQLGFAAHCGRLEDWNPPQIYDVISLADGLPRAADPKALLAAARRLLLPGGLLFLSLPNKDALAFAYLHAHGHNPYWSELTDYHLFGRERLYALLRSEGFAPLDYQVSESHRIGMEIIAQKQGWSAG